jgi:FGGY-family pentulose kinase
LSEKASEQLGLPSGIPVGSGVIDAYAGWIGTAGALVDLPSSGCCEQNDRYDMSDGPFSSFAVVAGTSTCHLAISKDSIFVDGVWGPYRDVLLSNYWISEGGQSATGELLKHVLETHPAYQETTLLANLSDVSMYDYLNSYLGKLADKGSAPSISHLARNLFFYGDLWGNRSPLADANMTGSVIGLTSDVSITGLALQYYGALEFIALQTRHIIDTMNKSGHSIRIIFMSGSQCQNGILMQLIATACNMPVVIPQYVNAAVVHGAALLGAKAGRAHKTGGKESLWSIMRQMNKTGRVELPSILRREKKLLDVKYTVFLEQSRLQREYRKAVDTALEHFQ